MHCLGFAESSNKFTKGFLLNKEAEEEHYAEYGAFPLTKSNKSLSNIERLRTLFPATKMKIQCVLVVVLFTSGLFVPDNK